MSHIFLANSNLNFHAMLYKIDADVAIALKHQGCKDCKGTLDSAKFPRKCAGTSAEFAEWYEYRFSFCCRDCRHRVTPPSVRFFGRRRFIASLFILLCASRLAPNESRCEQLARRFGFRVSVST